ncbi:MAG: crossover junction endodeoxyribonuclease RuvC [Actinomycetota bacterium]|jgi:crossover junction endodeoxyribonuclease RuvC|nr:crossover junction endodeoxyribonuclease RuvC [Actinomycetota bacterium]
MFVLGIDPGLSRCGYGAVRQTVRSTEVVSAGLITTPRELAVPERLSILLRDVQEILSELKPEVVAIERILFRSNAKTAMSVGQASGVILLAAFEAGCEIVEYSASEVKLAVAGYGSADKLQVQRMIQVLAKLEQIPRPPDVADALGLAFCYLANHSFQSALRATGRSESV